MRYSDEFGCWQLDDLPGCSQICVSHSAFVLPDARSKGYGDKYHKQRLQQMKDLHYECAIATVREGNVHQEMILNNNGWDKIHSITSKKTGNKVGIWIRNIT